MKVITVVGARPQLIKAAVVGRALATHGGIRESLLHTGQHFDDEMSAVFFEELGIPSPTYYLGISGGSHGEMTGRMLGAIEDILEADRPDGVIVYGDTNSTLAGALAAAKLGIRVAHVEAGLRSFNRNMPEELNRVVVDHLSTTLFCPTRGALVNTEREGLGKRAHLVGDVMFDAAIDAAAKAANSEPWSALGLERKAFAVATVHRAENTDSPEHLDRVIAYLNREATHWPVVLPLHPRTRLAAERYGVGFGHLLVCPPLGFLSMSALVAGSLCVYTDSGGLQKEAYFHRVPCVTLRSETEWIETVEAGWNRLWSVEQYAPRVEIADYGDGHAGEVIAKMLAAAWEM